MEDDADGHPDRHAERDDAPLAGPEAEV